MHELAQQESGSFIEHIARRFGTQTLMVLHNAGQDDEARHELESHLQGSKAYFDVDAGVYEGDTMELPDPRGGIRTVHVTDVKMNQAGGSMPAHMSHIVASFSSRPPQPRQKAAAQVIHGNAVIVSGNHVNIALDNGTINQKVSVTSGYEELAGVVKEVLTVLESTDGLDPDERDAAQEAATTVLNEIIKPEPDKSVVKRMLPMLRGVLQSAATAGAGSAATGLINQLFL